MNANEGIAVKQDSQANMIPIQNESDDDDDEMQFENSNDKTWKCCEWIQRIHTQMCVYSSTHYRKISLVAAILIVVGYFTYFAIVMSPTFGRPPFPVPNPENIFENNPGLALFCLTAIVLLFIGWDRLMRRYGTPWSQHMKGICFKYPRAWRFFKTGIFILFILFEGIFLAVSIGAKSPQNFVSLAGLFVFIAFMFIFSKYPGRVLPIVVFFSAAANVLFYYGLLQYITKKVAWLMSTLMGTTAGESMNASANIFMGQTESPLLIKTMLPKMTPSELHAVMTGGFATIAGSVMAAYVTFNVPAHHLIAASVMSAPAALATAKLLYPETKQSHTTWQMVQNMPKPKDKNVIDAICSGASQSILLVANIAVNLIAFLAMLSFLNATTSWLFGNVQHPEIDFQKLLAWIFFPVSWLMGVSSRDCLVVGELLGIKTFLNEFIAYQRLGQMISLRDSMNSSMLQNYHGTESVIYEHRSIVIATYALCGFSNFASIGIQLGGLSALAPTRRHTLAKIVLRAMVAGNIACFMTACIAGLLYEESSSSSSSF